MRSYSKAEKLSSTTYMKFFDLAQYVLLADTDYLIFSCLYWYFPNYKVWPHFWTQQQQPQCILRSEYASSDLLGLKIRVMQVSLSHVA